jgi:CRISPR/Cas system-associated endonuclease Cas1
MKNYYVISNGRIMRNQNTVFIEQESTGIKKPIPVEDVDSLYLFGEVDLNTKLLNFLSQKKITLHVFNYYGFYAGSYYPREYLNSGFLLVQQSMHYSDPAKRLMLAKETERGAAHSILRNLVYYAHRKGGAPDDSSADRGAQIDPSQPNSGVPSDIEMESDVDNAVEHSLSEESDRDAVPADEATTDEPIADDTNIAGESLRSIVESITKLAARIDNQRGVSDLMGIEGKMRERYYSGWKWILNEGWTFERRVRRPPDNEVNALISFGNSILYTVCLSEIYRTQLTPTVSFLHEPGERRFSLALDISELFKPLIVDRAIFKLINTKQINREHFEKTLDGCVLNDAGKRLFLQALEDKLSTTIRHRRLGRHVSYRHLIRLECYKLVRHLTGVEEYHAFRAWW